jgi:hypothetical protein
MWWCICLWKTLHRWSNTFMQIFLFSRRQKLDIVTCHPSCRKILKCSRPRQVYKWKSMHIWRQICYCLRHTHRPRLIESLDVHDTAKKSDFIDCVKLCNLLDFWFYKHGSITGERERESFHLTRPDLLGFLKNDGMEIAKNSFKKCSPSLSVVNVKNITMGCGYCSHLGTI